MGESIIIKQSEPFFQEKVDFVYKEIVRGKNPSDLAWLSTWGGGAELNITPTDKILIEFDKAVKT